MSISSPSEKFLHPLYLQIIGMGQEIVPLLLRETQRQPGDWHVALRSITRLNPTKDEDSGNVVKMSDAWLRWSRQQGHDVEPSQAEGSGLSTESEFDRQKRLFWA